MERIEKEGRILCKAVTNTTMQHFQLAIIRAHISAISSKEEDQLKANGSGPAARDVSLYTSYWNAYHIHKYICGIKSWVARMEDDNTTDAAQTYALISPWTCEKVWTVRIPHHPPLLAFTTQ